MLVLTVMLIETVVIMVVIMIVMVMMMSHDGSDRVIDGVVVGVTK